MRILSNKFQTTQWSVVLAARAGRDADARRALSSLCEAYWPPLYAFVRYRGHGEEEARDLTQAYFVKLLEQDYLKAVKPELGKFRTFLLASLKHFLANEWDKARTPSTGCAASWASRSLAAQPC